MKRLSLRLSHCFGTPCGCQIAMGHPYAGATAANGSRIEADDSRPAVPPALSQNPSVPLVVVRLSSVRSRQ